jgi:hypothetical protein
MTNPQEAPRSCNGNIRKRWYRLGHTPQAVRQTEAWEHENFLEEQARWERSDPEYAQICDAVRQAGKKGEEASRQADGEKAEWDRRLASARGASDDAQRATHTLEMDEAAHCQAAGTVRMLSGAPEPGTPR